MEAGHAAQNLCLQAAALDLKAVVVGAFEDEAVRRIALLPPGEEPLYLVPVGR
jgi:nitroreductase